MSTGERELKSILVDGARVAGFHLPPRIKWPGRECRRIAFVDCTFGSALMGGVLSRPSFRECSFTNCDLSGISAAKTAWVDCLFDGVALDGDVFGSIKHCAFRNCEFLRLSFGGMVFDSTTFENCRFQETLVRKVNFYGVRFASCSFSGRFSSVNWVRCKTSDVDLTSVRMSDCSLIDGPDADVKLPDTDENFLATYSDFVAAEQMVAEKFSADVHRSFLDAADHVRSSKYGDVLDPGFFDGIAVAEARALMAAFRASLHSKSM